MLAEKWAEAGQGLADVAAAQEKFGGTHGTGREDDALGGGRSCYQMKGPDFCAILFRDEQVVLFQRVLGFDRAADVAFAEMRAGALLGAVFVDEWFAVGRVGRSAEIILQIWVE